MAAETGPREEGPGRVARSPRATREDGAEGGATRWVGRWRRAMVAAALERLGDADAAEDIVQAALTKALLIARSNPNAVERGRDPRSWLVRTTRNLAYDALRRRDRRKRIRPENEDDIRRALFPRLDGVRTVDRKAGQVLDTAQRVLTPRLFALVRLMLIAIWFPSAGCSDSVPQQEVIHPTSDNQPPKSAAPIVRDTLPEGLSPDRLAAWRDARDSFEGAETLYRLGILAGDGPELFGQVSDVALSHNNHLFVLDGSAQQVGVFDPNGEFVESFGGLGDGPEEMRGAYAIVVEQEGDVLVFGTGRHIKVFRPTPAGYRFSEHRPLPISGGMACITASGRLIVAGADTRTDRNVVLHEIPRRAAEPVRSFGLGYRDSSAFIRFMVANRGPVACTEYEDRDVVLHAFVPLSFVRLLDIEDGAVLWVARLVDHQQLVMTGDATSLTQDPRTEWDIIVTLLPYHDHHALLQAERFEPITPAKARTMSGPPRGTVHTYLLDMPSGRGASVAVGLAQVMATNRARYAVVTIDPYPEIEIRAFATIEK